MEDTKQSTPTLESLEGTLLNEKYLIQRPLDHGGMGHIYLASQEPLGRPVAVKVLAERWAEDPIAVKRFEREAQGLSRLQHPNIVTMFDHGQEGSLLYIVMEHLEGATLKEYMRENGAMDLQTFLPMALQILWGLGEAHKEGLIHRDLKPENIMICPRENHPPLIKVLDFGLAKAVRGEEELTRQELLGSVLFLAPEQIKGGALGSQTDVYGLGVLFYFMLSNQLPIEGPDDYTVLTRHLHSPPRPLLEVLPPNHEIPEGLLNLVHRCLHKDHTLRPRDANHLLALVHEKTRGLLDLDSLEMPWMPAMHASAGHSASIPTHSVPSVPLHAISQENAAPEINPHALPTPPPPPPASNKRSLGLLYTALLACVILMGVLLATRTDLLGTGPPPRDNAIKILNQASDQIESGQFSDARENLTLAQKEVLPHKDLRERATTLQKRLQTEELMAQAYTLEKRGDKKGAVEICQKILNLNPNHSGARTQLQRLQAP